MEMPKRTEIKDENGYDRFLDSLDPGAHFHIGIIYNDGHRDRQLGGFLNYQDASDFMSQQLWLRKDRGKYSMVDPKKVGMYAVVDWVPKATNAYETPEVVAVPVQRAERPFTLRPALQGMR